MTRHLQCCVCGSYAGRWRQHWNRDTGYGICVRCVLEQRAAGVPAEEIAESYGLAGVNYAPLPAVTCSG